MRAIAYRVYHDRLMSLAAAPRDLTDAAQNEQVLALASAHMEERCIELHGPEPPTALELEAERLVQSRRRLAAAPGPAHLTVVWAMYGETGRMARRSEHEHGEDFVRAKVAQLDWLFDGLDPDKTWSIVACDDGCPDDPSSAEAMRAVIAEENYPRDGHRSVNVIELAEVLGRKASLHPVLANLESPDDSRKGGSIVAAMATAVKGGSRLDVVERGGCHVVAYTDADLSANVAQLGLLASPILERRARACLGQRYGVPGAVLVKPNGPMSEPDSTGTKPDKIIILFRHFVRAMLIPGLSHVIDTQAGFKAFDAQALEAVLPKMNSYNESFDVELLIHTASRFGAHSVGVEPMVFVEDFAATNFPSVDPGERHLEMIHQIVEVYDRYVAADAPVHGQASRLLAVLRLLDLDGYVRIINRLIELDDGDSTLFERRWAVEEIVNAVSSRAGFGRA